MLASITHNLIMCELYVRHEHRCGSGSVAGGLEEGPKDLWVGVVIAKAQTPLGATPPWLLTQLVISVHRISCTVSLEI